MKLLKRNDYLEEIASAIKQFPVVALVGARQSGKTTLAKAFEKYWCGLNKKSEVAYFDLEEPEDLKQLENPKQALGELTGLVIIDEIQRAPELFSYLRVLADRTPVKTRFLILGSAAGKLMQQSSESLAGRICYIELPGFGVREVEEEDYLKLWHRGGFPRSFIASSDAESYRWRKQFITTFLTQDLPSMGSMVSPQQLRRFWEMSAHYHGQLMNLSEMGRSLMLDYKTIRNYIDLLSDTFMVRQLQPWYVNIGKRVVKSPKFYIRDSGIFHALLGVDAPRSLMVHPKLGASWEGFALEQVIQITDSQDQSYFWATQSGAEMDLVIKVHGQLWGVEFKYSDAPSITKSMQVALKDLELTKVVVVYPGQKEYALADNIQVIPLKSVKTYFDHP